jgi:hypothetical protein
MPSFREHMCTRTHLYVSVNILMMLKGMSDGLVLQTLGSRWL